MSLNCDYSKIKDFRKIFPVRENPNGTQDENGTLMTVNYYCMILGMSEINEKNLQEFLTRMKIYDKLFGSIATIYTENGPEHIQVPYETLVKLVGLETNVSQQTRSQFMSNMISNLKRDMEREAVREIVVYQKELINQ
jgi:hypothetical protein